MPGVDELESIERAFADRGAPTQIELAYLADPAVGILLTELGYRLESFENVLGRTIERLPRATASAGIEVRRSGDEELEEWLRVVADSAAHPDTEGLPWPEEFPRGICDLAQRDSFDAGMRRYAALRGGVHAAHL